MDHSVSRVRQNLGPSHDLGGLCPPWHQRGAASDCGKFIVGMTSLLVATDIDSRGAELDYSESRAKACVSARAGRK